MFPPASWRHLARFVLFVCLGVMVSAEPELRAVFPGVSGESSAFVVGDGRFVVSVALAGARATEGRLMRGGNELPAEVFVDPVSRLVVFRVGEGAGTALSLRAECSDPAEAALRASNGAACRILGRVKTVDGKILPLALLKIAYDGGPALPGAPLMDLSGSVLAVAHQIDGAKVGYAVPVEVLRVLLERVRAGGSLSKGWIGLRLRPESQLPQVTLVQAGSPAAQAGVKPGDVLLELGDRRLVDYADAVNAFYFLRPGVAESLKIRRGSREVEVSVTPIDRLGS